MSKQEASKKIFSFSNIILVLAIVFVCLMLFVPGFKAGVTRTIMKIGFFQPKTERLHHPSPISKQNESGIVFYNDKGNPILLDSLKGKVIFINVWATWCGPCKAELPSIGQLEQEFSQNPNVVLLTIDADGNPKKSSAFLKNMGLSLPVLAVGENFPAFLSSDAIPFTVVLDKKGMIAYRHEGSANYSSKNFIQFMTSLAAEP